jgi:hypothetical protein
MEANRVAFLAGGNGWFEHLNALASEVERFKWELLPAGRIQISFTRYLFLQHGKPVEAQDHWHSDPQLMTVGVGLGSDALDGEVTVLTLDGSVEQPRRYALVRREVSNADDPTGHLS